MELRFISRDTKLDIQVFSYDPEFTKSESFIGTFYDTTTGLNFLVICDELFERFDEFKTDCYLRLTFYYRSEMYTFNGKLNATLKKNNIDMIQVNAISQLEKSSRRKSIRIDVSIPVSLYMISGGSAASDDKPVCAGYTQDISTDGICFFADDKIEAEDGSRFMVEFSLARFGTFTLPVKLMRHGRPPIATRYKYEYGFVFEYDDAPEAIKDLPLSLFKYKMDRIR